MAYYLQMFYPDLCSGRIVCTMDRFLYFVFNGGLFMSRFIKVLVFCFLFSGVIFAQQEDPSRELLNRARKGQINLKILEDLLSNGADVNAKEEKTGVTVLMYIASHGVLHVDVMKKLIEKGADVNAQDIEGRTPIMYSAMNYLARYKGPLSNTLWMVFYIASPEFKDLYTLIDAGADLEIKDSEGRRVIDRVKEFVTLPPLVVDDRYLAMSGDDMSAIDASQRKMLSFLEKQVSTANSAGVVSDQNLDSDIEKASISLLNKIKNRQFAVIGVIENLISRRGADVNYADENGVTVLMYAASHGFDALEVMKLLVKNGADVNAQDKMGQTPIMYAATNYLSRFQSLRSSWYDMIGIKKPEIADLYFLFTSGADLNIKDNEGRTVVDRVRVGVVQPVNIFSSSLGYEIVSFQDGQPKVLNVLEGYAKVHNAGEEVPVTSTVENKKTNNPTQNVVSKQDLENKLKEVRRAAWAERDQDIRDMMDAISYGKTGVSATNGEAINAFLERVLKDLSSDKSYEFNLAVGLLLNADVVDFMEKYELSRTSGDLTYGLMMIAIKDCRKFMLANEMNFASNPALVEIRDQKIREMNKAVERYMVK